MRFLNWEATLRKAREAGLMEGHTKGYIEGLALGRAEACAEGYAEARAEGYAEGRAEIDRAWAGWLQREADAAERNEPFDEPPPSQTQG